PTNPQIVYVPQYNTQVVYTQAPATVVVVEDDNTDEAIAAGLIGFTAGIAIGAAMDNSYYYGPYGWHGGGYMYNDAWDDYYDHRRDAREDYYENRSDAREDYYENRNDARDDVANNRDNARQDVANNRDNARQDVTNNRENA